MKRWVSLRHEALEDLEDAQDYFAKISPDLRDRFTLEVERTIEHLQDFPEAYQKVLGDVRRVLLKRFSFAMYYIAHKDWLEVVAVVAARRNPEVWQSRV